jgi:hypothetical protein
MRRTWKITLGGAVLLLMLCTAYAMRPVIFVEEEVAVSVFPDRIEVRGDYYFENPRPFPALQLIGYPYPVDENHPVPSSVRAELLAPNAHPLSVWNAFDQTFLVLWVGARARKSIRIEYTQEAKTPDAVYILTTTKDWPRPLEKAVLRLEPQGVDITHSSLPLTKNADHTLEYRSEDFLPTNDWGFSWDIQ